MREAGAAVALEGVTAGYGGAPVLSGLTCRVAPGEFVGVIGPSGVGKTTLLRLLTGGAHVYRGSVRVFDEPVRPGRPSARIGYVPQVEGVEMDFPLRVEQVVLLGLTSESRRVPWFDRGERRRARRILDRLGMAGLERRPISELSGGQQQRVFLARAMVRDSDLILLDEPTNGVDLATRGEILGLLGELNAEGMTIVLTTHDLNWVAAHLPRVVCLNRTIEADGPPHRVFTPEVLERTYGLPLRVVHDNGVVVVSDPEPIVRGMSLEVPR